MNPHPCRAATAAMIFLVAPLARGEAVLERVTVSGDAIVIDYRFDGGDAIELREHPIWSDTPVATWPIAESSGRHSAEVPRLVAGDAGERDRLLSRWSIGPVGEAKPASVRFADTVTTAVDAPHPPLRNKKGIGGFDGNRGFVTDHADLGISTVTVNVMLTFLFDTPADGRDEFAHDGTSYYVDRGLIAALDKTLQVAADHKLLVFCIVLVAKPTGSDPIRDAMAHPDYEPEGIFPMPNVTSERGVKAYSAALEYLARRYLRGDGPRIHHWIMHNEVDAAPVWTNAGKKTLDEFLDLYVLSMRIAHLTARQYDAQSRVFASVTHSWTRPTEPRFYASRHVLDGLVARSKAAGDFEWGIAYHPYPQSLFGPETWRDADAIDSPDSPLVTFKNLGVLVNWAREPANRVNGETIRDIYLTEQGFHSRDSSAAELYLTRP